MSFHTTCKIISQTSNNLLLINFDEKNHAIFIRSGCSINLNYRLSIKYPLILLILAFNPAFSIGKSIFGAQMTRCSLKKTISFSNF